MGPIEFDRIWLCFMKVLCKNTLYVIGKLQWRLWKVDGACHSVLELFLEIMTPASLSSSFWNAIQSSFSIDVSWDPKPCAYSSKVWDPQDAPLPGQGCFPGSCGIHLHGHQASYTTNCCSVSLSHAKPIYGWRDSRISSSNSFLKVLHSLLLSIQSHANTHIRIGNHTENRLCLPQMKTC